jgi:hypothetical protein
LSKPLADKVANTIDEALKINSWVPIGSQRPRRLARRSRLICCLSTRIPASSATRDRNRSLAIAKINRHKASIGASIARFSVNCQHDRIYDRDRRIKHFFPVAVPPSDAD